MATVRKMCAPGARRSGVVATFARREGLRARLIVWAPGAAGALQPIGTVGIQWQAPGAGEATLDEVAWPPTHGAAELWRAIEDLAGRPIRR